MTLWIIVRERWAEGPRYFTNIKGDLSHLRERAMRFTDRSMAWEAAEAFDNGGGNIRVVPTDGSWGA